MKARRHTAGFLTLVTVLATSLMGAAYALWFEDLTLTADLSTGTLDADASIHDIYAADGSPGGFEGVPVVAVNPSGSVASIFATPGGYDDFAPFPPNMPTTSCNGSLGTGGTLPENANDAVDDNALLLTPSGLYEYAGCEYEIDIHNDGSVPFHVTLMAVSLEKCDITGTTCAPQLAAPWTIGIDPTDDDLLACQALLGALDSFIGSPILIELPGPMPLQLHSGDEVDCRFKLILDSPEEDEENVMWKFSATYRAHQWNMGPIPPP